MDTEQRSRSPRVLLVMPDHWPRALLRAELLERGCDAVGAPDMKTALLSRPVERGRGRIGAILIDQEALDESATRLLGVLFSRYKGARVLLLANALLEKPSGPWYRVLYRPASIDRLASAIEEALRA